jgi:asparagine synthase (glutamine-hydrolysing)
MSALGGIYSRDGAPIDRRSLDHLADALETIGPDGRDLLATASVAMIFRPFHTDRESRRTRQPVVASDGCVLTWNGRLDNRKALEPDLTDLLPEGAREADVVLAAYQRWGTGALARLIGDFSLALWDPDERCLVLACDAFSIRPLYYHVSPDFVFWASRARALLGAADLAPDVDEEFVAGFLTSSTPSSHSAFSKVQMLPPGHLLVARGEQLRLTRYWSPDPGHQIRYRSDKDYEEHFREVFRQAVACRMRAEGPVFSDLSGGLDSSSIVCVGDEILARNEAETPDLCTASWVFEEATTVDERRFIAVVEEKRGRRGLHIRDEDYPMLSSIPSSYQPDYPHGQLAFFARNELMGSAMAQAGCRVLLRGLAGDQVLWAGIAQAPLELADLVSQGRLLRAARSCVRWSRSLRQPFVETLWRGGIHPLLPWSLRARTQTQYPLGNWFQSSFVERMRLMDRVLGVEDDVGFQFPSGRLKYGLIREASRDIGWEFFTTSGCIEMRFPYLDRRLVEFSLAVDLEQLMRPGETKSVLRRALRGTLPEEIRLRHSKVGLDEAVYRNLVKRGAWLSGLLSDLRASEYGFVDKQALSETLRRVRHGQRVTTPQLLRTFCLEFWLRSLAGRHSCERKVEFPASSKIPRQTINKGDDYAEVRVAQSD